MYSPCFMCKNHFGVDYTEWCDSNCEYAMTVKRLNELKLYCTDITEAIECMKGNKVPTALLADDKIDSTYEIVSRVKMMKDERS